MLKEINANSKLTRLIKNNFTKDDILIHCFYNLDEMQNSELKVKKDIQDYFRRVKAYRREHGLPQLKYIYAIHKSRNNKWHWHGIMSAMDKEAAEKLWSHGISKVRKSNFTKTEHFESFARYISDKSISSICTSRKLWVCSRNLRRRS